MTCKSLNLRTLRPNSQAFFDIVSTELKSYCKSGQNLGLNKFWSYDIGEMDGMMVNLMLG